MSKKIMLVEDDPGTLKIIQRMIGRIDCTAEVYCADSAEIAYSTLTFASDAKKPFNLVIADLNLPNQDGLTLKELFQRKHPEMDFLFISGVTYEEWSQRTARHADTPVFIQKPVSEKKLRMFWEQYFETVGTFAG